MKSICMLIALATLALMLPMRAMADDEIVYSFNPGSTFNFGNGNDYAAEGSFTYDATTEQVTSVDYQAVQIGDGPTGPFDFTTATTISPTDVIFTGDCCNDGTAYLFAESLATGGIIDITGGNYYAGGDFVTSIAASGSVTAGGSAVPEPSGLLLMGTGLIGLALFGMRRKPAKPMPTSNLA